MGPRLGGPSFSSLRAARYSFFAPLIALARLVSPVASFSSSQSSQSVTFAWVRKSGRLLRGAAFSITSSCRFAQAVTWRTNWPYWPSQNGVPQIVFSPSSCFTITEHRHFGGWSFGTLM